MRRSACACRRPKGPARRPNVEAEAAHGKGWFEVQDEGSQIAALLAGAGAAHAGARFLRRRRRQDAGAGRRACRTPARSTPTTPTSSAAADLRAPEARRACATCRCWTRATRRHSRRSGRASTSSSSMRPARARAPGGRKPDANGALKPATSRRAPGRAGARARPAAPPGEAGRRLVYVTCSVLPEENRDQVDGFPRRAIRISPRCPVRDALGRALAGPPRSADGRDDSLLLTPRGTAQTASSSPCFRAGTSNLRARTGKRRRCASGIRPQMYSCIVAIGQLSIAR